MPLEHLSTALADAVAHPLSAKRLMLAALLIDAEADRQLPPGGDLLAHRAMLAARSPALALVFDLSAMHEAGPKLVTEAVEVPLGDYPKLSEADFMVSLYNRHTVQRVRIALPDGSRRDALEALREAAAALSGQSGLPPP
jgi:hypothetical protein